MRRLTARIALLTLLWTVMSPMALASAMPSHHGCGQNTSAQSHHHDMAAIAGHAMSGHMMMDAEMMQPADSRDATFQSTDCCENHECCKAMCCSASAEPASPAQRFAQSVRTFAGAPSQRVIASVYFSSHTVRGPPARIA